MKKYKYIGCTGQYFTKDGEYETRICDDGYITIDAAGLKHGITNEYLAVNFALVKTVIDAVNELRVCDPTRRLTNPGWYINQIGALSFNGQQVCTREEYNKCVDEMSTNYGASIPYSQYKADSAGMDFCVPEVMPVYTQAMADKGQLPGVGMECMISDETYSAEYFSGVILFVGISNTVWTHGKVEYSQSSQYLNFKPITPPIDLIDGEAYKFIYNGKFNIGIYDSDDGRFYFPRGYVLSSYPTNIKHLTV
mgnify:CR=1 FL=1